MQGISVFAFIMVTLIYPNLLLLVVVGGIVLLTKRKPN